MRRRSWRPRWRRTSSWPSADTAASGPGDRCWHRPPGPETGADTGLRGRYGRLSPGRRRRRAGPAVSGPAPVVPGLAGGGPHSRRVLASWPCHPCHPCRAHGGRGGIRSEGQRTGRITWEAVAGAYDLKGVGWAPEAVAGEGAGYAPGGERTPAGPWPGPCLRSPAPRVDGAASGTQPRHGCPRLPREGVCSRLPSLPALPSLPPTAAARLRLRCLEAPEPALPRADPEPRALKVIPFGPSSPSGPPPAEDLPRATSGNP